MANYIDKKSQYIKEYYSNKFYYKNITSKRYLEYNNYNLDFINNIENSLSKINKDLKKSQYSLNLNYEYFTKILDNINF